MSKGNSGAATLETGSGPCKGLESFQGPSTGTSGSISTSEGAKISVLPQCNVEESTGIVYYTREFHSLEHVTNDVIGSIGFSPLARCTHAKLRKLQQLHINIDITSPRDHGEHPNRPQGRTKGAGQASRPQTKET